MDHTAQLSSAQMMMEIAQPQVLLISYRAYSASEERLALGDFECLATLWDQDVHGGEVIGFLVALHLRDSHGVRYLQL